jgi:acetyl-CoA carboxylase alpha subunit
MKRSLIVAALLFVVGCGPSYRDLSARLDVEKAKLSELEASRDALIAELQAPLDAKEAELYQAIDDYKEIGRASRDPKYLDLAEDLLSDIAKLHEGKKMAEQTAINRFAKVIDKQLAVMNDVETRMEAVAP